MAQYVLDVTVRSDTMSRRKNDIAALFCLPRSVYAYIPGIEVYTEKENALNYIDTDKQIIAHPPCRFWSRMHGLAKPRKNEYELALWAFDRVNQNGGVLEHPADSGLWEYLNLPRSKLFLVDQIHFGHLLKKTTALYSPNVQFLEVPFVLEPWVARKHINQVSKRQAMATPVRFAEYIVNSIRSRNERS